MTNAVDDLTFTYAVERRKHMTGEGGEVFLLANTANLFVVLFQSRWAVGCRTSSAAPPDDGAHGGHDVARLHRASRDAVGSPVTFIGGQLLMAVPLGMALGLQGAMLVEIFPLRTRVTSMSLAYSISSHWPAGRRRLWPPGYPPLGEPLAPAYYIMLYGAIGLALMWPMPETNARRLNE